jgi:glycosyltransferase involved in cell wall biosynthesis
VQSQRWIVVADSPFLPPTGGGEQEHLGFVRAAAGEGLLALLVLPDGDTVDLKEYIRLLPGVPVLPTPRRTNPLLLAHPTTPYVVASRPAPAWLVPRARELAPDATGIVIFSYKSRWIGEALARGLDLSAVIRQHNREGAYHRSLAAQTPGPRGWVLRWEAMRIERDERRLGHAEWLAGTADISLADADWRRGTGAPNVVHVPPFALGLSQDPQDAAQAPGGPRAVGGPPRVLFLGTLDTATNTGALDWFLGRVWPTVLAGHPDVVLDVVGRGPSPALRRRLEAAERVELAADVPDVGPYLRRAAVAVNPVISGSGVNIKLVEYLDAGLPLVSTSLATEGLPLGPGVDLEVHDDPAGFASAVLRLLEHPDEALVMAAHGRAHLRELLDVKTNLARIGELLSPKRSASPASR